MTLEAAFWELTGTMLGVLTINGKAELVVQDAAAYQALLDRVEAIKEFRTDLRT